MASQNFGNLSADDQKRIANILQATGLAKHSPDLPDSDFKLAADAGTAGFINFCKIGCDLAQAAATAACAALPPPLNAVCIAVAAAAGDACRSEC